MTKVVDASDLAVGDHVTVFYRYPQRGVTKPYVMEHVGVIKQVESNNAYIVDPDDSDRGRWVNTETCNSQFTIDVERHRRAWVEGGDYLITYRSDPDPENCTRIWRRRSDGWDAFGTILLDRNVSSTVTVGQRVLITPADR